MQLERMKKMRIQRQRRAKRAGFTLIEVLLVVAILGVIAAAVVPALLGRQQAAYEQQTRTNVKSLQNIVKMYALDHDGQYPSGGREALNSLTSAADYHGKKIAAYVDAVPKDAWGEQLYYEYPTSKGKGDQPAIWSSGPNRQNEDGAGDDINSWTEQ
jgi:general secretion pathway protein G